MKYLKTMSELLNESQDVEVRDGDIVDGVVQNESIDIIAPLVPDENSLAIEGDDEEVILKDEEDEE